MGVWSFRPEPQGQAFTPHSLLASGLESPLPLGTTLGGSTANEFLQTYGLGSSIRRFTLPDEAPAPDLIFTPTNGDPIAVPDQPYYRGEMERKARIGAGTLRMETSAEFATRVPPVPGRPVAMSQEDWKQSASFRDDIPWDAGMTEERAAALAEQYDVRKVREFYGAKRPITAFIGTVAGQAFDLVNYIPIFGEAVTAASVARLGAIGGRAFKSSIDAAANIALAGAATADERALLGDDVSWQTQLTQIAVGAMVGAAFGTIHGGVRSYRERGLAEKISTLANTQKARAALNEQIDLMARDGETRIGPASQAFIDQLARSGDNLPPVPDGYVRLYHGGLDPTSGGGRFVTPDLDYAKNFRAGDQPNQVHYVDIPKNDPVLKNVTDEVNDFLRNGELPEQWAKKLKPVLTAKPNETTSSLPRLDVPDPTRLEAEARVGKQEAMAELATAAGIKAPKAGGSKRGKTPKEEDITGLVAAEEATRAAKKAIPIKKARMPADPELKMPRFPALNMLRKAGGVKVGSPLAQLLGREDITPLTNPGLFVKQGGLSAADRFPRSESRLFSERADEEGLGTYVSEREILQAIRDEKFGSPMRTADEQALIEDFKAKMDALEPVSRESGPLVEAPPPGSQDDYGYAEQDDVNQLRAEKGGKLAPEDEAAIAEADEQFREANAYGDAFEAAMSCVVGSI